MAGFSLFCIVLSCFASIWLVLVLLFARFGLFWVVLGLLFLFRFGLFWVLLAPLMSTFGLLWIVLECFDLLLLDLAHFRALFCWLGLFCIVLSRFRRFGPF